ncbi:MAG: DUF192 domain-containing protein [Actinobacteria bacterium]|nr:DUF192 domain-containing protein [Actinomycetota bacterium]
MLHNTFANDGWRSGAITTAFGVIPACIAHTRSLRRRGLLGLDNFDSILVLPKTRWIHTLGMQFPIDVAHLNASGLIVAMETVKPNQITRPVLSAQVVLESYAGMMFRHGLRKGMNIAVNHAPSAAI